VTGSLLPVATIATSFVAGLLIFPLHEDNVRVRSVLNIAAALIKVGLVAAMMWGISRGARYETDIALLPGISLEFRVEQISLLFGSLSALLWLVTTIYAIGYMEQEPARSRFFGFFALSVAATMGIAIAGNLLTFFIFYEALTLATYPLVAHHGTEKALRAGRSYLAYTLGGGVVLLLGVLVLYATTGAADLRPGGTLVGAAPAATLTLAYVLIVAGLAVKAATVPVHGWLPKAMVAPAPVSALLHAVAVVKAGAYGIVRVTYDLYGVELARELGVLTLLAVFASITIVYGSIRALRQVELKPLLAWSTVSQVSYITLGVSLFGALGTIGALVHLVHQGLMKITLFFCAGAIDRTLGITRMDEMDGVGRRMPLTMGAFTVGALGMIGLPPIAGFISKWYLGLGALEQPAGWAVVGVLVVSTVLNAAYFLPVLRRAWFGERKEAFEQRREPRRVEAQWSLFVPAVVTAALALTTGTFASSWFSPRTFAEDVTEQLYEP
jgi:multicomponent Na+:H+ antiporter subunit D